MSNPTLIYKEGQKEVSSKHSISPLSLFSPLHELKLPQQPIPTRVCLILCVMEWIIGLWILMGIILTWCCYWFLSVKKENGDRLKQKKKKKKKGKVPRGNKGWPLLGETLEFIACGYTSNPVSFMEKRKSLLAASIERIAYPKKEEQKSLLLP